MVAGGDDQPRCDGIDDRRVVVGGRAVAAPHGLDLHLLDARQHPSRAFEQGVEPARRHARAKPAILHRRADDEVAVALRGHVDLLGPDHAGQRAGLARGPQGQGLPLQGAHRQGEAVGQEPALPAPGAGREHDRLGGEAPGLRQHAGHAPARPVEAGDGHALDDRHARRLAGAHQRRHDEARIDLMVEGALHARRHRGAQDGFQAADLGAVQPRRVEAGAALQIVAEAQALHLVAADGEHQRAVRPVIDGEAGGGFELVAEAGPAGERVHGEGQERVGAGLVLGGRRQHPRGGEARAGTDAPPLDHRDGEPRDARRHALARPISPPPMTATSARAGRLVVRASSPGSRRCPMGETGLGSPMATLRLSGGGMGPGAS